MGKAVLGRVSMLLRVWCRFLGTLCYPRHMRCALRCALQPKWGEVGKSALSNRNGGKSPSAPTGRLQQRLRLSNSSHAPVPSPNDGFLTTRWKHPRGGHGARFKHKISLGVWLAIVPTLQPRMSFRLVVKPDRFVSKAPHRRQRVLQCLIAAALAGCGPWIGNSVAQWAPSDAFSVPGAARSSRRPRRGRADSSSSTDAAPRLLTSQLSKVGSARELLQILDGELDSPSFNKFHIGAAFTRLAKHKGTFDVTLQGSHAVSRLIAKTAELLAEDKLPARESANVLWAIASMGEIRVSMQTLLPLLVDSAVINVKLLEPQHICNIIWAGATLQLPDAELKRMLPCLCCRVPELTDDFKVQEVSKMIWASAVLKGRAPALLEIDEDLAKMATERAAEFTEQGLANIVWSAATLKSDAPFLLGVLPRLMEEVPRVAKDLKAQGVSNILWAGAALRGTCHSVAPCHASFAAGSSCQASQGSSTRSRQFGLGAGPAGSITAGSFRCSQEALSGGHQPCG